MKEITISETDAVELAKQALVTDGQEYYKDKTVIFHIDQVRDVQANCRTWKSHRFWEVQFTVPAEEILQEILDVYCTIRIDADTGECLEVATSAK